MKAAPPEWRALALIEAAVSQRVAGVELGIGDDCAVLRPSRGGQVWTVDACLEGVHFNWDWLSPADIAHKALHAAVSDAAAMGARPLGALSHVTLRPGVTPAALKKFAAGQAEAARLAECPIIGGNLAYGQTFQVVTSVLGQLAPRQKPLLRSGARPGDEIWLLGEVGLATLGLGLLQANARRGGAAASSLRTAAARRCLAAFRRPVAQVEAGRALVGRASACIDVSDGLAGDAAHIAKQSGVRLVLHGAALLAPAAPQLSVVAKLLKRAPLDAILYGGEDYALLATGPAKKRPRGAAVIGQVERGQGVFLATNGRLEKLKSGFEHGRER